MFQKAVIITFAKEVIRIFAIPGQLIRWIKAQEDLPNDIGLQRGDILRQQEIQQLRIHFGACSDGNLQYVQIGGLIPVRFASSVLSGFEYIVEDILIVKCSLHHILVLGEESFEWSYLPGQRCCSERRLSQGVGSKSEPLR